MRFAPAIALFGCMVAPAWGVIKMSADPKAAPVRKVCMLPVEAKLTHVGLSTRHPPAKESDEWAAQIQEMMRRAMAGAGARLVGNPAAAPSAESADAVMRIRRKYDALFEQMRKKPGGVRKARYTLGDEVALIPCAAQADALAFVGGAAKIYDSVAGGLIGLAMAQNSYDIWIGLVDAKSGEVTSLLRAMPLTRKEAGDPDGPLVEELAGQLKKDHVGAPRRSP